MKRLWPWSSNPEDRFETWLRKQHEARLHSGEMAPVGPCPDNSFLRDLARRRKAIDLADPRIDHAVDCPKCSTRLLVLRRDHRAQQRRWQMAIAGAVWVVLVAMLILVPQWKQPRPQIASNNGVISRTVDLRNAGTYRGQQPAPLKSVVLPATRVRLTIILPEFSQSGRYLVAVTRDQAGTQVVSEATVNSISRGNQETVSVVLDLQNASAGEYFLSTTYEKGQAAYYYPLRIR